MSEPAAAADAGADSSAIAPAPAPGLLTRIKARLETPAKGAATLSGTLRDFLLLTWAVPAETVRPHVPEGLTLDVLPGPEGDLRAFIQVACFYHENFHWTPMKGGGESFHQVTYRVLTRRQGKRGVFDLRAYLSSDDARNGLRVLAREADFARFTVYITGDPAREQYLGYSLRAVGDRGQTSIEITFPEADTAAAPAAAPAPFARFEDMTQFLTQREEEYFAASVPKDAVGMAPLHHEPLTPRANGVLQSARASLFTDLGLLTPDEVLKPLAVLLQPAFALTAYPPRLVRLTEG